MSGVGLVIPIKATVGAKQRLSSRLAPEQRRMLALAMAGDTLRLATRALPASRIVVVAGDEEVETLAQRCGVTSIREPGTGQSAAVRAGMAWARDHGFTAAVALAADCPLARLEDVDALLEAASRRGRRLACVPDLQGIGTNAAALRPVDAPVWRFGANSLSRHEDAAIGLGLHFEVLDLPSLRLDCDRPEDAARIASSPAPTATFHVLRELGLVDRRAVG